MNKNRTTNELKQLDQAHHLHPFTDFKQYKKSGGRIISRAEHIYIYDSDDNKLLDAMSGLWCCNLGYSQDKIKQAVAEQIQELPYYNNFFNCSNEPAVKMAKALVDVTPKQFNQVFFTNSGSEANDTNIKLVHRYYDLLGKPDKKQIISRKNAYHGSTIAASSLGGMGYMHDQFKGLDYIHHIAQPYWYTQGGDLDQDAFGLKAAQELESKILEVGEDKIAAFIAEPIQGAGGVIVPPKTYWPEIKRICHQYDILLISDEVICGFGRTGNWFGCETYDYEPDLMTFAKGVTNGYLPLGGVMVSDKVANVLNSHDGDFNHGLTYSGHPVSCAAGLATLEILTEQKIIENLNDNVANHMQKRWKELENHPIVGEARIEGLVASLEIVQDKSSKQRLAPNAKGTVFCREVTMQNGVIVRATDDSIIAAPPLICNTEEIDQLVDALIIGLDATAKNYNIA